MVVAFYFLSGIALGIAIGAVCAFLLFALAED